MSNKFFCITFIIPNFSWDSGRLGTTDQSNQCEQLKYASYSFYRSIKSIFLKLISTNAKSVAFYLSNSTWFHSGSISTEATPTLSFYLFILESRDRRDRHTETNNEETVLNETV